jgi:predicted acylesterase/phospholipase RssA/CRP-like cAMP-binding protein
MLAARPMLSGVEPETIAEVEAAFEPFRVRGGEHVVRRGQTGVPLIIVARGGLRASYVDGQGHRHDVLEYFQGAAACEALVLSGCPAPLDLHAVRDSHLLLLAPEKFQVLAKRHPDLALHFARVIATHLVELFNSAELLSSFAQMADRVPHTVVVLGAGGESVRRMREHLADNLSGARRVVRLNGDEARRTTGGSHDGGAHDGEAEAAYERLLEWRCERDRGSELALLECEPSNPSWLDFCLRQADRILVLADEKALDPFGPGGRGLDWWRNAKIGERCCHIDLAIVHDRSDSLPRHGAMYAKLPGVSRLHHVRRENAAADAGRLARWLLDRPVGLVFGGGGALGIAHVGVLKALEEARIPVDIVGGTSMGAIFAGGNARGWSADEIMDHVRATFAPPFALYDPTIPLVSILAGKKMERVLRGLFEDIDIADLWTPFFCVSTNISHAHTEVHDSGSLWRAIRSSCSIPGLFPPYQLLKMILVDGGLIDNLPIDVMGEVCRGPVIAVDVFPYQRQKHEDEKRRRPLLERLSRFLPRSRGGPSLFDILVHATLVGSQRTTVASLARHPPALYLAPDLSRFHLLEWRSYQGLFDAGYACAKREIESGALPRRLWEGRIEGGAA